MAWLDALLGGAPPEKNRSVEVLSWLAGGMVLVGLLLFALQQSLRLPAHFGVEDWLGWQGADVLATALEVWRQGQSRLPAATAYVLIDTALFMPLYGLTLLWATRQVHGTLQLVGPLHWLISALRWLALPTLLALWGVDAIENLGGLARLGISRGWGLAALLTAAAAFWLLRRWAATGGRLALAALALTLLAVSLAAWQLPVGQPDATGLFDGRAHHWKPYAMGAAALPPLGLWLCWWFGLDIDSRPTRQANRDAEIRSACRQTAMGIIGRSRYVLAVLALFAAFTLMLDQCRDVLLALASPALNAWWPVALLAGALGMAMLSHACWLWARLAGRIKRSGYEVSALDGVADWAGEWARTWARLLMLAPLLMASALVANVAGDAVIAASASRDPGGLFWTLIVLALFAAAIVGIALWLMQHRRQHVLPRPSDYYNAVAAVRPLLHDPWCLPPSHGGQPRAPVAAPATGRAGRVLGLLALPVWQPLVALALLLGVRGWMLLDPALTGTAPAALAVLALSLVWWLGPLGLIALSEQRAVFPWALLLLAAAGLVGMVSDNHTLPALVIGDAGQVPGTLAALRRVALAGLLLLAVVSAVIWLVLVLRSRELLGRLGVLARVEADRVHTVADRWRIGLCALAAALLCGGLAGLDAWAARAMPPPPDAPSAEATLPPAGEPLLLVASEGGGVRAAYWTARVLAGITDARPAWPADVVAMSGVSGGSMGIAVWRACLRSQPQGEQAMTRCVQRGFDGLDALSPLLAGLLFEDVWMRLLPTDLLCQANSGCGLRSRAMAFEREWMRAFPRLAEPLGRAGDGEPHLLLNSTVVESGNRAVLGTLRLRPGDLPGAEDLLTSGRVRRSPALVTAAHTSARFPFTNPLASLPHAASGPAAAHLVDGGYHDNSGTASLADLLTHLQAAAPGRRVQLVLIRNGQLRTRCLPQALAESHGEPPPDCLKLYAESDARDLLPPRDAQRLKLFADLFGPAVTVLNNLGTGAHGREPVAALAARVAAGRPLPPDRGCTADAPVCLLDQMQDASLVPLGWTLSPAARAAMDARADELLRSTQPR
ncbi:hypothetical protein [Roseateles asaccharophilus]|uniref:PNPLA domain-containing protein n=1 Tax=Roseateles asaccharophilus TaxID=582607 RepID=A0ABU2A7K8_9BURK|nr:hypothetical protein [Roseateles asaccharophilus]MDR7333186.1 hypothetical protein [Roseateles asaccharophilus]